MAHHHTENITQQPHHGLQALCDLSTLLPPLPLSQSLCPRPLGAVLLFLEHTKHRPSQGPCIGCFLSPAPLLAQDPHAPSLISPDL